jgi:hypothetical protein
VLAHPRSNRFLPQATKKDPKKKLRSDDFKQDKERKFHLHIRFAPPSGYKNEGAKEVKSIKCRSSPTQANVKQHDKQAKFFAREGGW